MPNVASKLILRHRVIPPTAQHPRPTTHQFLLREGAIIFFNLSCQIICPVIDKIGGETFSKSQISNKTPNCIKILFSNSQKQNIFSVLQSILNKNCILKRKKKLSKLPKIAQNFKSEFSKFQSRNFAKNSPIDMWAGD